MKVYQQTPLADLKGAAKVLTNLNKVCEIKTVSSRLISYLGFPEEGVRVLELPFVQVGKREGPIWYGLIFFI